VQQREVSIARSVGNQWWISAGLSRGDQLIVEGGQKVRVGEKVSTVSLDPAQFASTATVTNQ
jgi:membrane fusion protein (multidrug efflux system)